MTKRKPTTKQGQHGTLYLYEVTYTDDERAILAGAAELEARGELLSPGNDRGRKAVRRLCELKLLELVGWAGADVTTPPLYKLTAAGRVVKEGA